MRRRVVVTGTGLISPSDVDPARDLAPRNTRPLDRLSQLVVLAAARALDDARCDADYRAAHDVGLALGTVFSGVRTICAFDRRALEAGPQYVSPLDFANTVLNAAAGQAAIWHHLRGANATIAAGCASGLQAIAYAADMIASGASVAMVAGGADERSPEAAAAVAAAFVGHSPLVDAAAMVVLEAEDMARARGAAIRAMILGQASGMVHTAEGGGVDASCAARVARTALDEAGLRDVDARVTSDGMRAIAGGALGAAGALQMIATLDRLRAEPHIRTVLIEATGADGQCCAMIVAAPPGAA